jgi:hypothetical protein
MTTWARMTSEAAKSLHQTAAGQQSVRWTEGAAPQEPQPGSWPDIW